MTARRFRLALLAGTALTFATLNPPSAMATTDTYDGAGAITSNGNFNLGTNYDTGTAPGAGDTAVFNDTATVAKDANISFANTSNPLSTLSLAASTTSYTFTIGAGQSFSPGNIVSAGTANQDINNLGTLSVNAITSTNTTSLVFRDVAPTIGSYSDTGGGALDFSDVTSGTVSIGSLSSTSANSTVYLNGTTLTVGSSNATTTYAGGIYDDNGNNSTLNKVGTGTLTVGSGIELSNYGALNVQAGTLVVNNDIGQAGLVTVSSGATLQLGTTSFAAVAGFQGAGNIVLGMGDTLYSGGNNPTTPNPVFSGVISGAGALQIETDDNGNKQVLTLTNANTYTGGTTITGGSAIAAGNNAALGTGNLTLVADGALGVATGTTAVTIANALSLGGGGGGSLEAGAGQTLTYSGLISGANPLSIVPNFTGTSGTGGTVVLSNTSNSYTGATNINGATLSIGNATELGSTSGLTFQANGGTLQTTAGVTLAENVALTGNGTVDTQTNNSTLSGVVSGTGSMTKVGAGALALSGANTYSGGTNLNGGTVSVTAANNLGTGAVTFNGGILDPNGAFSATTYANNLVIGNVGGTINNAGFIYNATFSGLVSGAGPLTLTGSGTDTITVAHTNTYTGGTTIAGGTVALGANNGLGTGAIAQSGTLELFTFNQSTSALTGVGSISSTGGALSVASGNYGGAYSGTGSLTKTGAGTLILTGANTYSGGTTISGGTLDIPFVGNLPGAVIDNGVLQFSQTAGQTGQESALISGTGSLLISGGGNFNVTHTNTYTGGTQLMAGTLTSGANNALGTGPLSVASGATFSQATFNQAVDGLSGAGTITSTGGTLNNTGAGTFTGIITSTAGLVVDGFMQEVGHGESVATTQVLDGTSTFSNTTVSSGMLEVGDANTPSAMLNSPVTVSGGTLLGHGTINGNVTNMAGAVQPGGTIGTLTVNGNYAQSANSTLGIELNPTTSSLLQVNGSASIAGTLAIYPDSGAYVVGKQYTVLTATNGLTGTFATVTNSNPGLTFSEVYTPTAVDLNLTAIANSGGPALPPAITFNEGNLTPNEASATNAIVSILPATEAGAFRNGLIAFASSPGVQGQQAAIAGVLGELRADIGTIDLANLTSFNNFVTQRMDSRMGLGTMTQVNNGLPGTFDVAMNDSDMNLFGVPGSNAAVTLDRPSAWFHGYGVLGSAGGQTGYQDFEYQTGGIVGGLDAKVTDSTLVGAAVAYEHTDFHLSGDEGESNTIDTYRVTVYGSQDLGVVSVPLTLDAAFGYAFNDYHDNDSLAVPGFGLSQTSRHEGNELTAQTGLSHGFSVDQDVVSGALSIVPRVGIEYDNIQQNSYATTGAATPGLNLSTSGSTLNALRSTLGGKADLKMKTNDGTVITPEVRASYLHDFEDTSVPLSESFTGAPGAAFRIAGVRPGRDAALAGAGVNVGFSENLSATFGYDAAVRTHELDHTVQVGIKYTW